ncbi:hypothetical protein CEXT_106931 [Caerostris extrusa]|uniref:Uncharacterized protein n=1 Tax=Caerostris extrusa TaxID=172846 RepID=A0AAV4QL48_CAEEX|nr:hypothetical protein CEXT_106931 [Caerostris extrusa]
MPLLHLSFFRGSSNFRRNSDFRECVQLYKASISLRGTSSLPRRKQSNKVHAKMGLIPTYLSHHALLVLYVDMKAKASGCPPRN